MQSSDIPDKFNIPFGNSAGGSYIRRIPENSQIGVNDGWASLTDGFVPLNATPPESGGIPPFMQDMNGILKQISAWSRWVGAGGPVRYDSAFQAAIGGYPKGSTVQSAVSDGIWWISLVENNVTNPDSGGAGWMRIAPADYLQMADVLGLFESGSNANGYWSKRPAGGGRTLIEQWGRVSLIQTEGGITRNFPIAFTDSASISITGTIIGEGNAGNDMFLQTGPTPATNTQYTFWYQSQTSGNTGRGFTWYARGY